MYLTGVRNPSVDVHLERGELGLLVTPNSGYTVRDEWTHFAFDSGCFNDKTYKGDAGYLSWLDRFTPEQRQRCMFATAPDVVGNGWASLRRSLPFLPILRAMGYKAALVTQDGMTPDDIPWRTVDWLFIGGTDAHKRGTEAKELIAAAARHGKLVHVGRVNGGRTFQAFASLGDHVASADGTVLRFDQARLPKLVHWVKQSQEQTLIPLDEPC